MPSESIILELLRQKFQQDQQTTATSDPLTRINQVMEGIARGISLYDAAKSLPAKFGTPATTATTPGAPAIPGIPGVEGTSPSLMGATAFTPGTGGGASSMLSNLIPQMMQSSPGMPAIPGLPATPPVTTTTPGIPGSLALDSLSKLKDFSGPAVQNIFNSLLAPYGIQGGLEPALKSIYDPTGSLLFKAPKGSTVLPTATVPLYTFNPDSGKYFDNTTGNEVKLKDIARGARIERLASSKGGAGTKTPADKFSDLLGKIEDDVKASVKPNELMQYARPGTPKYEKYYAEWQGARKKEFITRLNARGGACPKELKDQAIEELFGTPGAQALEAQMWKQQNQTMLQRYRERLNALKTSGTLDPVKQRKELMERNTPPQIVDELMNEVLQQK